MAVRVLFFDVFGTVVDWRTGILDAFHAMAARTGIERNWAPLVDDWRRAYPGAMAVARRQPIWRNLDDLQSETLDSVLAEHDVTLPVHERSTLVRAWRRLPPWPDSRAGLAELRRFFVTATLSNGHLALLVDLARFGDLPFDAVLSAELASSYKPDPAVYRRAATLLECTPEQTAMVAAHPGDLEAAAALGMRPVFVPRPLEWGTGTPTPDAPDLPGLVVAETLGAISAALGRA
jgi:2-haloacid dehalogenase